MSSIDFWLYTLYMRCNLLKGRSIISVFSLLVLLMYFYNFVSLSWHRKNYIIDGGADQKSAQKIAQAPWRTEEHITDHTDIHKIAAARLHDYSYGSKNSVSAAAPNTVSA